MELYVLVKRMVEAGESRFEGWHSAKIGDDFTVEAVHAFPNEAMAWMYAMGEDPTPEHREKVFATLEVMRLASPGGKLTDRRSGER